MDEHHDDEHDAYVAFQEGSRLLATTTRTRP